MKKIILSLTLLIILTLFSHSITYANDFIVTTDYEIYLENLTDNEVRVQETLEIQSNNKEFYIPANTTQTISIPRVNNHKETDDTKLKKETITVRDASNRNMQYEIKEVEEGIYIYIKYPKEISHNNSFFAKVEYKTTGLIDQSGNIINLYLPGLHKDTVFQETDQKNNLTTIYKYDLGYNVPLDAPNPSFLSPKTITSSKTNQYIRYTIDQNDRLDNTGWIQLGTTQYYYFKIIQDVPKTDNITPPKLNRFGDWISTNIVHLTLPKIFEETNQEIFIKNINYEINRINIDNEKNIIAIFEPKANETKTIEIEGYIKLSKETKEIPNMTIEKYKEGLRSLERFEIYLQEDKYWESEDPKIKAVAEKIFNENKEDGILGIIKANYNYIIDTLEYSKGKAEGENPRIGALKTLEGGEAVCMEYSDLFIAISRAQGIASRAAIGYGNDPHKESESNNLAAGLGHQWVQVWIPTYGWLSIDPTWGDTGSREYIGGDLDHILWYSIGSSKEQIVDTRMFSADFFEPKHFLDNYEIIVQSKRENEIPNLENMTKLDDLIAEYKDKEEMSDLEWTLKTTILGRSLIFILPALGIFFVTIILTMILFKIIRKRKERN